MTEGFWANGPPRWASLIMFPFADIFLFIVPTVRKGEDGGWEMKARGEEESSSEEGGRRVSRTVQVHAHTKMFISSNFNYVPSAKQVRALAVCRRGQPVTHEGRAIVFLVRCRRRTVKFRATPLVAPVSRPKTCRACKQSRAKSLRAKENALKPLMLTTVGACCRCWRCLCH